MIVLGQEQVFQRRTATIYHEQRRRARHDNQQVDYTLDQLRQLVAAAGFCPYCRRMLMPATFSVDHAMPVCRTADYRMANLTVCCRPCNESKGMLSGEEFQALLTVVDGFHVPARLNLLARLRAGAKKAAGKGW